MRAANESDPHGGFEGVFGFSQGGALASLLCALAQSRPESAPLPRLRCAAFAGAFRFGAKEPDFSAAFAAPMQRLPTLHLIGAQDDVVQPRTSEALAAWCGARAERCEHASGHVPCPAESVETVASFFERTTGGPRSSL